MIITISCTRSTYCTDIKYYNTPIYIYIAKIKCFNLCVEAQPSALHKTESSPESISRCVLKESSERIKIRILISLELRL